MRVVLIGCSSTKLQTEEKVEATKLYNSTLFKYSLKYAHSLNPDKIFILSALHGLVKPDDMIGPYNYSLLDMSRFMRQMWATDILSNLTKEGCNLSEDEFVIIAGQRYREYLLPSLQNVSIPLNGLNIGEQLSRLKKFAGGLIV